MVSGRASAGLALALGLACVQPGLDETFSPAELDRDYFRCQVEPVLVARCAFFACHGSNRRPLRLFAVQKLRLATPWDERDAPLSDAEHAANYDMARGFAGGPGPERPQLLDKPLDVEAGGLYHRGKTLYGEEDVFTSEDDPGYRIVSEWLAGAAADPGCIPTEEVGP
jgi:hypothetical protein